MTFCSILVSMALGFSFLARFITFSIFDHLLKVSFDHSEILLVLVFCLLIVFVKADFGLSLELNPICLKDSSVWQDDQI